MQRKFLKLSIPLMLGYVLIPLYSHSMEEHGSINPVEQNVSKPEFSDKGLLTLDYYQTWLERHGENPLREDEKTIIMKAALPAQGNVKYGLYEAIDPHHAITYRSINKFKELQTKLAQEGNPNFKAIAVIGAGWKMARSTGFSNNWESMKEKNMILPKMKYII